jgi:hypothetical protein
VGWGSRKQKANNGVGSRCNKIRQDKCTITYFKVKFKTISGRRIREKKN